MPTLIELGREQQRKRAELQAIFDRCKTDDIDPNTGRPVYNMDGTTLQEVNERNEELKRLNDSYEALRLDEIREQNAEEQRKLNQVDRRVSAYGMMDRPPKTEKMSLAEHVLNSIEYKTKDSHGKKFSLEIPNVELKTLMETTAGFAPETPRSGKIVLSAQRRPVVADLIPTDPTNLGTITWMEETTYSNQASEVAEGSVKPESALAFTERSSTVAKIAHWLPVTEEQLDDVPGIRSLIDNRLTLGLQLREEQQLLNGNGVTPNLRGILNNANIQTQAKGTDSVPDAIYKAMTKVRNTGMAEPSGVIMHSNDWMAVRLLTTTDGIYIFGSPADEVTPRIWGKPVVVSDAITENTALTGDFVLYAHISRKLGIRIDVSDSHDTYFIYNKYAIRAEERLSLEVFRGAAFCKITGV